MTAPTRGAARADLAARLAVQDARAAGRSGDLARAAEILDTVPTGGTPSPAALAALDLRARVHAQRAEWTEADACWARVQEQQPDDPAAAAGRRTVGRITAGRRRPRPVLTAGRLTVAAAAAVAVLAGGGAAAVPATRHRPSTPSLRLDGVHRYLVALQHRAADNAARQQAAARRSQRLDAIAAALGGPGVTARRRTDDVRLVFAHGLFAQDVDLTPEAATLLADVGRRIAALDVTVTVVGHVVPVPGGRTAGGSAVGLARAQSAATVLAESAGLPYTDVTLASADQSQNPFPDAARDRTVTILLAPRH